MVGAKVAIKPMTGEKIKRCFGGKMVKSVANTVGIIAPPRKPCSARHTIISPIELESAHMMLISVKLAAADTKSQRVEKMRVSVPESGIITTSAMR